MKRLPRLLFVVFLLLVMVAPAAPAMAQADLPLEPPFFAGSARWTLPTTTSMRR